MQPTTAAPAGTDVQAVSFSFSQQSDGGCFAFEGARLSTARLTMPAIEAASKRPPMDAISRADGLCCKRMRTSNDSSSQDSSLEEASTVSPYLFDQADAPWRRHHGSDLSCIEAGLLPAPVGCGNDADEDDLNAAQSPTPTPTRRSPTPRAHSPSPGPDDDDTLDRDIAAMLRVLCDAEASTRVDPSHLDARHGAAATGERHIDAGMRRTAVGWMVEVSAEFGLQQETLHLATSLLDRFLASSRAVPRGQLQLVGVCCLLVAAKHEEEAHPSVHEFVRIADNCFTAADLLRMESLLLSALSFRVEAPTAHTFLSLIKGAVAMRPEVAAMGAYLIELAMMDHSMLALAPSQVAAAAAALAAAYFDDAHTLRALPALVPASVASAQGIGCMQRLLGLQHSAHSSPPTHSPALPVHDKFSAPGWHQVALMTPLEQLDGLFFAAPTPSP